MHFETQRSVLFSDTLLSDVFITEYMDNSDGDYVKVYLYCLFLSKNKKNVAINDLAKKLSLDISKVKQAVAYWENMGVFLKTEHGLMLTDLKEKEVHKLYRPRLSSSPEAALENTEKNVKRSQMITAINNTFFQGIMSPSWYMDVDAWFTRFSFEDDVMFSLFKYCFDRHALNKNYILCVAEGWHEKGIKNYFDLENYFFEYEKCNEIKKKVCKKLGLLRKLTEYEEGYVDKWVLDYKYDFDIIEIALKKTTAKTNPNFEYLNTIISEWHKNSLKTILDIQNQAKEFKQNFKEKKENDLKNKLIRADETDLTKFYDDYSSEY